MKIKFICASLFMAGLSLSSCSSDNTIDRMPEDAAEHTLTFNLSLPAGEKVSYSRALHDAEEYAINKLTLYEYEVITGEDGAKTTSLARVMEYPDGTGKNVIDLKSTENNKYSFSIIVPAANDGKTYTYKFVANRNAQNKELGLSFEESLGKRSLYYTEDNTKNLDGGLAERYSGFAMTGTAVKDDNEELLMTKGLTCEVKMVRTSARIDIKHAIPNLLITSVVYRGFINKNFYFPQTELPSEGDAEMYEMKLNYDVKLPTKYLNDPENTDTEVNLKKAFYVYGRKNEETKTASVAIEYKVSANGKEYDGSIEVLFKSTTTGEYVDILRNHLYTIVLGNGDPISGKVTAKIVVDDWNAVDIDEPLTDDDNEVTNND